MREKSKAVKPKTVAPRLAKSNPEKIKISPETVIECGERLDIFEIENLAEKLKKALGVGNPIVFDATLIQRVDTAALQLLVAFFTEASSRSAKTSWRAPPRVLCESARLLGITRELMLPGF